MSFVFKYLYLLLQIQNEQITFLNLHFKFSVSGLRFGKLALDCAKCEEVLKEIERVHGARSLWFILPKKLFSKYAKFTL